MCGASTLALGAVFSSPLGFVCPSFNLLLSFCLQPLLQGIITLQTSISIQCLPGSGVGSSKGEVMPSHPEDPQPQNPAGVVC